MTPTWATVVIAIVGPLVGGTLALLITAWQSSRDAARQTDQLGAEALAGALATINDASPDGLALNTSPEMLDHLEEVRQRWQETVRVALLEFSLRTASDDARRLARDLAAAVPGLVNIAALYVRTVVEFGAQAASSEVSIDMWRTAQAKHASVVKVSGELEGALRAARRPRWWLHR